MAAVPGCFCFFPGTSASVPGGGGGGCSLSEGGRGNRKNILTGGGGGIEYRRVQVLCV